MAKPKILPEIKKKEKEEPLPENVNIVHAAAAAAEHGPETVSLLAAIFEHNQAERDHFDNLQQSWWAEDRARFLALKHGVQAALARCEPGGTTREYEACLTRIANSISLASYGSILEWYKEQILEKMRSGEGHFSFEPIHEMFRDHVVRDGWD